jgi:DNA primase
MTPVEQIKDRLNIVDVVSMYVKLEPAGKNLKAKSPFTNERTPSFYVSPDKGLYHCFSTGKGGDIFTFVQELEGLDFRGALKVLADRAGVKLGPVDVRAEKERDRQYEIMEKATEFYETNLANNPEAMKYLKDRGVEDHVIKDFRIGYAPADWRRLYDELKGKYPDRELVMAGVGKQSPKGIYDTFRDRIMFPIMDTAGRPIAFSGRILHPDEKSAKYVNSPDTPLFNKSDVLFGLDKAKHFIRKYNFTTLVEGQFDVVMMHQAGFRNTVGVSGTALSESLAGASGVNNLGLVKRLSDNLVLAFDADSAGEKAAKRSAHIALGLGMDVKVVSITGGKDPAEFLQTNGKDAWSALLRDARHVIEFTTMKIMSASSDAREQGRRIQAEVLPDIAALNSEIEKSYFIKKIRDLSGIDEAVLQRELDKIRTPGDKSVSTAPEKREERSRTQSIERKLLGLYFSKSDDAHIKEELARAFGQEKFDELLKKYQDVRQELVFETEMISAEEDGEISYREMLTNLEEDYLSARMDSLKSRIKEAEVGRNDNEAEKLAEEYQQMARRLGEIKNSRHINKI